MIAFQILAIAAAAIFLALTIRRLVLRRIAPLAGIVWALLWLAAAIAIAVPETTVVVARFLGIQRGADLVLYCAILGMLGGFFQVFNRLRRIERDLTVLVRRLALAEGKDVADHATIEPAGRPAADDA